MTQDRWRGARRRLRRTPALVWCGLALFVLGVYVVIVLAGGAIVGQTASPHLALSILATTVVALGFGPVQSRLQSLAWRKVDGGRHSPYDVLTTLSTTTVNSYPTEELPHRMALVLAEGTGAEWAQVWLVVRGRPTLAATWPPGAATAERDWDPTERPGLRVMSVRQAGETLAVLRLQERDGEPLTAVEERLFRGLADQAGLVLTEVRLRAELEQRLRESAERAEELVASRRQLVDAQDAERRRLERNIHDGAQQHLVALAVGLRLAQTLSARSSERAREVLDEQADAARDAIAALTELSRGLYPRVLVRQGLGPALEAVTATSVPPVRLSVTDGRAPAEVEAAAYFCGVEALQNATKHAHATEIAVTATLSRDGLQLSVADDGVGFEPSGTAEGEGIANMRARVESLGGELKVTSEPSQGTRVDIGIPLHAGPGVRG